jgi:hypothetical protein
VNLIGITKLLSKTKKFIFIKHYNIIVISFTTGAYGPSMRLAEPSMTRRNPALDRLPASRVARGGKGYLPVNQ